MSNSNSTHEEKQANGAHALADVLTSEKVSVEEITVDASLFYSKHDNQPKSYRGSLKGLLGSVHEVRKEKDGPAFSPAVFTEGAARSCASVERLSFLAFDADHESEERLVVRQQLLGSCARVVYTTFSDQQEGKNDRRFRLLLPVSRPFTADEHRLIYSVVGNLVGGYDPAASDPPHIFFKPAVPLERKAFAKLLYVDGVSVDVDKVLTLAASMPKRPSPSPRFNRSTRGSLLAESRLSSLFKNCEAADRLARAGRLRQLKHDEGFALLSWVACFENGVNRFISKMVGWGKTPDQLKQIEHFVEKKRYAPYSCARAQELGVCKKKDPEACLKARGTAGAKVSPSPIRFALQTLNINHHVDAIMKKYGVGHE
ncbi:MAG: hypothetical protein KF802_14625 [Bdellovibrionaceae bacterium]|nr:hypothetical protein [Pseudobdellovibrionaceae bacterium]